MNIFIDVRVIDPLLFRPGNGGKSLDFFYVLRPKHRLAFIVINQINSNVSMVFEDRKNFFFLFGFALLENLQ